MTPAMFAQDPINVAIPPVQPERAPLWGPLKWVEPLRSIPQSVRALDGHLSGLRADIQTSTSTMKSTIDSIRSEFQSHVDSAKSSTSSFKANLEANAKSARESVEALKKQFADFQDRLPDMVKDMRRDTLRDGTRFADSVVATVTDHAILILCLTGILYAALGAIRARTLTETILHGMLGTALLGVVAARYYKLLTGTIQTAYQHISDWFSSCEKNEKVTQAGIFDTLGAFTATLLSTAIVGTAPTGKALKEFSGCLGNWKRVSEGTSEFTTWVHDLFLRIINRIRHWCGKEEVEEFSIGIEAVDKWRIRVRAFVDDYAFNKDKPINPDNFPIAFNLRQEGADFKFKYGKGKDGVALSRCIDQYLRYLEPIYSVLESTTMDHAMRMVPVCIYLYGPPGSGKSSVAQALCHRVLAYYWRDKPAYLELLKKNPNLFCYAHDPAREFWDGCRPDIMCLQFNDFFQNPDPVSKEAFELMQSVDTFPQHLHMSDIADKKSTFIRPIFVVVSSNLDSTPKALLRVPEALDRRLHFRVMCTYRPEYCLQSENKGELNTIDEIKTRKLNTAKLKTDSNFTVGEAVGRPWDPEILEYHNLTVTSSSVEVSPEPIYFDQLVERICRRLDQHKADFLASTESYRKYVAEAIRKNTSPGEKTTQSGCICGVCEECQVRIAKELTALHSEPPPAPAAAAHSPPPARPLPPTPKDPDPPTERPPPPAPSPFFYPNQEETDPSVVPAGGPPLQLIKTTIDPEAEAAAEEARCISLAQSEGNFYHKLLTANADEFRRLFDDQHTSNAYIDRVHEEAMKLLRDPTYTARVMRDARGFVLVDSQIWGRREVDPVVESMIRSRHLLWRDAVVNEVAYVLTRARRDAAPRIGTHIDACIAFYERFSRLPTGFTPFLSLIDYSHNIAPDRLWDAFVIKMRTIRKQFTEDPAITKLDLVLSWLPFIGAILALGGVIYGVYRYFRKEEKTDSDSHSGERIPMMVKREVPVPTAPTVRVTHSALDQTASDLIRQALHSNVYRIVDDKNNCSNGLVLVKGRSFMINTHFVRRLDAWIKVGFLHKDGNVLIEKVSTGVRYEVPVKDFLSSIAATKFGTSDISVGVISNGQVPQAADMLDKIPTLEEHQKLVREGHYVAILKYTGAIPEIFVTTVRPVENSLANDPGNGVIKFRYGYDYNGKFQPGNCMELGYLCNPQARATRLIFAHAAGDSSGGTGTALIREDIEEALKSFEPQIAPIITERITQSDPFAKFNGFPLVYNLKKEEVHHTAGRTDIIHSPIGRLKNRPWPDTLAPARLRPFDKDDVTVHPYLLSSSKYMYRCVPLSNLTPIEACCVSTRSSLEKAYFGRPEYYGRILPFEEAIAGSELNPYIRAIPRQTSPGYPHVLRSKGMPGKTYWLGKEGPVDFSTAPMQELRKEVEEAIALMSQGKIPEFVCLDFLKDELRPLEKVETGQTRFISATNIVLLTIMKMYFGDFSAWMQEARISNSSAIGVNPHSPEWERLYHHLKSLGTENFSDCDVKALDSSLLAHIVELILKHIIEPHYKNSTPADRLVRRCLIELIVRSMHAHMDTIYQWLMGHPSGHFLTALLNTIYMMVIYRAAWLVTCKLTPDYLEIFDQEVRLIAQGDDSVTNCSKNTGVYFKPLNVSQAFAQFGLTMTSADKLKLLTNEFKKLEDTTFLKRGFRVEPTLNRHVGPLSLVTIHEMINWQSRKDTNHAFAKATFGNAIRELAVHSEAVWKTDAPLMFDMYKRAYGHSYPIQDRLILLEAAMTKGVLTGQDLIGLLGAAASIGDGPNTRVGAGHTNLRPCRLSRCFVVILLALVVYSDLLISPQLWQPHGIDRSRVVPEALYIRRQTLRPDECSWVAETSTQNKAEQTTVAASNVPTSDSQSITTISNDRPGVSAEVNHSADVPSSLRHMNTTQFVPSIAEWLGNFQTVNTTTVDATYLAGSFIFSYPLDSFFSNSVIAPKLVGFQGIVGDFIVKVISNANQYQQGRYLLVWLPAYNVGQLGYAARLTSLATITQLPHAEIDIACDSEVDLRIPFIFPSAFHNLMTGDGDYGNIGLVVYDPFQTGTGGSTSFNFTTMISMDPKTVQVFNPTYNLTPTRTVQSGRRPKSGGSVSEKEAAKAGKGYISSGAGMVAKIAGAATIAVPEAAVITMPVKWAAELIGGIASYFGYSKPRDESGPGRMSKAILYGSGNCDVISTSHQLALCNYNKVEGMLSFAGKAEDEMQLAYLLSKTYWFNTYNWTTSNAPGTLIASITMCPMSFTRTISGPPSAIASGPLAYLAAQFTFYRGSIKLVLKFTKTPIHQGRLAIVFYPGVAIAPTSSFAPYGHREIVDISQFNEWSFIVPFTSDQPYLPVTSSFGLVAIYVVNELTGPSTVASNINILAEVCGGPDLELYHPSENQYVPALYTGVTARPTKVVQSGGIPMCRPFRGGAGGQIPPASEVVPTPPPHPQRSHCAGCLCFYDGCPCSMGDLSPQHRQHPCSFDLDAANADIATHCLVLLKKPKLDANHTVPTRVVHSAGPPSMGDSGLACRGVENGPIGGARIHDPKMDAAKYVAGERVMSIKQLMLASTCPVTSTVSGMTNTNDYFFRPFTIGVSYPSAGNFVNSDFSCDYFARFASMYAFSRGSMMMQFFGLQSISTFSVFSADLLTNSAMVNPVVVSAIANTTNLRRYFQGWDGHLNVSIPALGTTWARVNRLAAIRGSTGTPEPNDKYSAQALIRVNNPSGSAVTLRITRNVADDFQLGMFIGVLPYTQQPFGDPPAPHQDVGDRSDLPASALTTALPSTRDTAGWRGGPTQNGTTDQGKYRNLGPL